MNTKIGLLCLLSVSVVSTVERYKYRLLPPSPSPTRPPAQRQYQPRISRQLDSRDDSGPYLNKESFFSAGFLEDLFGLGRPAELTVSFQGKREITPGSHPSHFPSFFAPVRSLPTSAFVPSSPYQPNPYHSHHQSLPPVQQHHHTTPPVKITRNDNNKPQTPYKYTVKGSSTHYVDNSQPAQISAEQHKVKPFRHHGGLKQQPQPRAALFSSMTPQNVIAPSKKPSMEELLNNIDQYQTSTTPGTVSNDVRSFQNFDVTPSNFIQEHQLHHPSQPKKDVFQIFQKVAEQFSLVKDINQNVGEMKNSIESTTTPVLFTETDPSIISENPLGTTDHPDITSAGLFADDSPGNLRNVVIQADKKNAKSFSSVSTATSSSGLISQATTRKSESSAVNRRRITDRVVVQTESAARSQSERRRKSQKPSRNFVTTGFSSFPYRDKSSKYNAKLMVKDEGQDPRSPSEVVSLEDKQGRKEETLKKLLAIAGEDWTTQSEEETPVRQRQREKFECPDPEGHFSDPGRCDVYYRCVHGRPTRLMCGAGLLWNTETGQCDWEAEVMCESLSRRPRTTA